MRFYFVLFLSLSLTACSLPRGAALMQEVVRETKTDSPSFQVIEVTRTELATVAQWPRAAKQTKTYWPKASKGPNSSTIRAGDTVEAGEPLCTVHADVDAKLDDASSLIDRSEMIRVRGARETLVERV